MLETQEDVDIDGMERCKGLCKDTFRQDSGGGWVQFLCLTALFFYIGGYELSKLSNLEHLDLELNHFNNSILSYMERLWSLKF
jgi:hypothetical protein